MEANVVIFSDLDGTLLDYRTYSFRKAIPALRYIKQRGIPLIICTSKTRAEIEVYQKRIKNRHPFISENGGGIFIPQKYYKKIPSGLKKKNSYLVKELGKPYQILREKLIALSIKFGVETRGFGDMTAKEIHKKYGLPLKQASLAKKREYDEPFYFLSQPDENVLNRVKKEFSRHGLKFVPGGRLFHLMGDNDKGKAVKSLIKMYAKEWGKKVISIGIGDSLNDLPLLSAVNIPIVVKLYTGRYEQRVIEKLKEPFLTEGIGPEGWNEAVLQILRTMAEDN
jgi:mannosyl-3-phosphoglycerate phosphatase family protein